MLNFKIYTASSASENLLLVSMYNSETGGCKYYILLYDGGTFSFQLLDNICNFPDSYTITEIEDFDLSILISNNTLNGSSASIIAAKYNVTSKENLSAELKRIITNQQKRL